MADLKKVIKEINDALDDIGSAENMKALGMEMVSVIRKRVRVSTKGSVASQFGPQEKIKELSDTSVKIRKQLKKEGLLSSYTTPTRSNLTRTGAMLNSMTADAKKDEVEIKFITKENERKAREVQDAGRPFMFVSDRELRGLVKFLVDIVEKRLKKL